MFYTFLLCLPLWGKWIEISNDWKPRSRTVGVFPCGGSGLKCVKSLHVPEKRGVFPCGGSGLKCCLGKGVFEDGEVSSPVGEVD